MPWVSFHCLTLVLIPRECSSHSSPRPSLSQALLQMVLQDENFVSKEEFQAVEKKLVVSNGLCRLLIFSHFLGSLWMGTVIEASESLQPYL